MAKKNTNWIWLVLIIGGILYFGQGGFMGATTNPGYKLEVQSATAKAIIGGRIEATIVLKNTGQVSTGQFLVEIQPEIQTGTNSMFSVAPTQEVCESDWIKNVHKDVEILPGQSESITLLSPQEGMLSNARYLVNAVIYDSCCSENPSCQPMEVWQNGQMWVDGIKVIATGITVNTFQPIDCGNNLCDNPVENFGNCVQDCRTSWCGDGWCDPLKENYNVCNRDCTNTGDSTNDPIDTVNSKKQSVTKEALLDLTTGDLLLSACTATSQCMSGDCIKISKLKEDEYFTEEKQEEYYEDSKKVSGYFWTVAGGIGGIILCSATSAITVASWGSVTPITAPILVTACGAAGALVGKYLTTYKADWVEANQQEDENVEGFCISNWEPGGGCNPNSPWAKIGEVFGVTECSTKVMIGIIAIIFIVIIALSFLMPRK